MNLNSEDKIPLVLGILVHLGLSFENVRGREAWYDSNPGTFETLNLGLQKSRVSLCSKKLVD